MKYVFLILKEIILLILLVTINCQNLRNSNENRIQRKLACAIECMKGNNFFYNA